MSFLLYKPVGLTPLEALHRAKKQFPQYASFRLGVAGRLDPMAEGLLLVMVDEENKNQDDYMLLNKEYSVDLILGVTTDSYDLLGIPGLHNSIKDDNWPSDQMVRSVLAGMVGSRLQSYPPYSAVRVKSKPLFWWARQGRMDEIEIPSKERKISRLDIIQHSSITSTELMVQIEQKLNLVKGDFRQAEVTRKWKAILQPKILLPTYSIHVACSSGTYVRSIVHELGQKLGVGAVTMNICRTKIGEYELKDALRLNND